MSITTDLVSRIQIIPGYFTLQVHPEDSEVLSIIEKINDPLNKLTESTTITQIFQYKKTCPENVGHLLALNYMEKNLLSLNFLQLKEEQLLTEIKKINWLITHNQYGRGEYRKCDLLIWNDAIMPSLENRNAESFKIIDKFILKNSTEAQINLWKETRKKIWNIAFDKKRNLQDIIYFTDDEKILLKDLVGFVPEASLVSYSMQQFSHDLIQKIKAKEQVFSMMAWIHQTLIKIHPFIDGNGRTARLVMNMVGMWHGKSPFLIMNNKDYSLNSRSLDCQLFAKYLEELEKHQIKVNDIFNQNLRSSFNQCCQNLVLSLFESAFK